MSGTVQPTSVQQPKWVETKDFFGASSALFEKARDWAVVDGLYTPFNCTVSAIIGIASVALGCLEFPFKVMYNTAAVVANTLITAVKGEKPAPEKPAAPTRVQQVKDAATGHKAGIATGLASAAGAGWWVLPAAFALGPFALVGAATATVAAGLGVGAAVDAGVRAIHQKIDEEAAEPKTKKA